MIVVIGLTIAHVLSTNYTRNEAEITIIARDMPDSSMDSTGWASPWAVRLSSNPHTLQLTDVELRAQTGFLLRTATQRTAGKGNPTKSSRVILFREILLWYAEKPSLMYEARFELF